MRKLLAGSGLPGVLIYLCAFSLTVSAQSSAGDIQFPKTIAWSAYPTGTGGYSQAVAIGNILQRQYSTNLRVIPGRNDVSRLATLRAERVHFSAGGSESVYAQEGVLNFASKIWGPQPVRAVLSNYSDACSYSIATAADADIRSMADMEGKRMTFVQGAPSLNNATAALLAYANLTWDDVIPVEVGGYNGSIDAVLNDRADAAGGACNSPPFLRLEASPRGLRWPELPHDDPEAVDRVRARLPWYVPHTAVEGPTISGDGIQVFSSAYPFLVALAETDDRLVYSMVKVMLEHFNVYKGNAPGANGWSIDRQKFDQAFVPYHPGAIRYFKEIGVWTKAAEKINQANLHRQQVLQDAWESYLPNAPEGYQAFEEGWLQAREAALKTAGLITLGEGL